MEIKTDEKTVSEPIDCGFVEPLEVPNCSEPQQEPSEQEFYPLSSALTGVVCMVCSTLAPTRPVAETERKALEDSIVALEKFYGPFDGGPIVLWGNCIVTLGMIAYPRVLAYLEEAKRIKEQQDHDKGSSVTS